MGINSLTSVSIRHAIDFRRGPRPLPPQWWRRRLDRGARLQPLKIWQHSHSCDLIHVLRRKERKRRVALHRQLVGGHRASGHPVVAAEGSVFEFDRLDPKAEAKKAQKDAEK